MGKFLDIVNKINNNSIEQNKTKINSWLKELQTEIEKNSIYDPTLSDTNNKIKTICKQWENIDYSFDAVPLGDSTFSIRTYDNFNEYTIIFSYNGIASNYCDDLASIKWSKLTLNLDADNKRINELATVIDNISITEIVELLVKQQQKQNQEIEDRIKRQLEQYGLL